MTDGTFDPPIAAEVDLRDFEYMPLDVVRVRDSDTITETNGEEFKAAFLLWCAAWHQVPAGSLPDNDRVLAKLAGFGHVLRAWLKVKDGAMRGWKKATDGRFYHSTVVEKAKQSWHKKLTDAHRRECDRIRKDNKARSDRREEMAPVPHFLDWFSARNHVGDPHGNPLLSARKPSEFHAESGLKVREGKVNKNARTTQPVDNFGDKNGGIAPPAESKPTSPNGAQAPKPPAGWRSDATTAARYGEQLGVRAFPNESLAAYVARIDVALQAAKARTRSRAH